MTASEDQLQKQILKEIDTNNEIADTLKWAISQGVDHQDVVGQVKSLCSLEVLEATQHERREWEALAAGQDALNDKLPELLLARALASAPDKACARGALHALMGDGADEAAATAAFNAAMRRRWLSMDKATRSVSLSDAGARAAAASAVDIDAHVPALKALRAVLAGAADDDAAALKAVRRVKWAKETVHKVYAVRRGAAFTLDVRKAAADVTHELLQGDAWRTANFKAYNFDAMGARVDGGALHPLLKVRAEYRQIFLEMGFTEMRTNRWVESSFWNFDALFQPQQHPARDAHDTFFLLAPAATNAAMLDADYVARVRRMHESGDAESLGYRYAWDPREALKNILRTHTTAVSSRSLYELAAAQPADGGAFRPAKMFSIDRVFRNEATDATHLAEFHQIEGWIADRNLTLGDLIGVLARFFERIGARRLKFKPAYNPYTEPSMEVFIYDEVRGAWLEVGNSGVFRPEMLKPMGLPDDVRVIAWGLGLERQTMTKYRLSDIRTLVGHRCDVSYIKEHGIVRLEK